MDDLSGSKIGLLGGSFNPVHIGHLIIAQSAMETFDLSKVIFIPCAKPPHKNGRGLIEARHRLRMLELAVEHDLNFEVSEVEIQRGGVSYTIDTIWQLQRMMPDARFHFIIGSDTLPELHLWKDVGDLLESCEFLTLVRPCFDVTSIKPEDLQLEPPWPEKLLANVSAGVRVDVSSSDIRHRVAEGMSIRYLVPGEVEVYIGEHGLYSGQ